MIKGKVKQCYAFYLVHYIVLSSKKNVSTLEVSILKHVYLWIYIYPIYKDEIGLGVGWGLNMER